MGSIYTHNKESATNAYSVDQNDTVADDTGNEGITAEAQEEVLEVYGNANAAASSQEADAAQDLGEEDYYSDVPMSEEELETLKKFGIDLYDPNSDDEESFY